MNCSFKSARLRSAVAVRCRTERWRDFTRRAAKSTDDAVRLIVHWKQLLLPLMGGTRRGVDSAYLLPVHRESGPRDDRPHIREPGGTSDVRPARLHGRALPSDNSRPI